MSQYYQYSYDRQLLAQEKEQAKLQFQKYTNLIQEYQKSQLFYHDLKNHYLVINNLINQKNYEKAKYYIQNLTPPPIMSEYTFHTSMLSVDILLSSKMAQANSYKIHQIFNVNAIPLALNEQDLISLLGNALDNAIEACLLQTQGIKWIRFEIYSIHDMTFIKVCNSCNINNTFSSKIPPSSKPHPEIHGFGLRSIQSIVQKYDGLLKTTYANGTFTLCIIFFY